MKYSKYSIVLFFSIILLSCRNPNQIAKIKYDMQGCFGSEKSELVIYKNGNDTIAKLTTVARKAVRAKLNISQVEDIDIFIKELKAMQGGGCTTEEIFTAYINDEKIERTIRNCEWSGFLNLKKSLFAINNRMY